LEKALAVAEELGLTAGQVRGLLEERWKPTSDASER
jgi:hypothetical protein